MNVRLKDVALFIFCPLLLGSLIYVFCRTTTIYFVDWLAQVLPGISSIQLNVPYWIIYHLPDGLWAFAFSSASMIIWNWEINKENGLWHSLPLLSALLLELNYGTFDPGDLLFILSGALLPLALCQIMLSKPQRI